MCRRSVPERVRIDGSEAIAAATWSDHDEHGTSIAIREMKYLIYPVEQDDYDMNRVTRPKRGFKSFEAAQCTLAGVERMHMLKKRPR
jgi:putative transposase